MSQWCDEGEAMRKIEELESNPAFAALVESAVLAPYRRWAAQRSDLDAFANGRAFVHQVAFMAAARAVPSFISLKMDHGPARVAAQQRLIGALAQKLADAAMVIIQQEASATGSSCAYSRTIATRFRSR